MNDLRLNTKVLNAVRFDHCVERERRSALALTPAAVATVNEKRRCSDPVPDSTAVATDFEWIADGGAHEFWM